MEKAMSSLPDLSKTEWMAVSVAFQDAADCGCAIPPAPGSFRARLNKLARRLFGGEANTPLADPRLEALRRFVCTTRVKRRPVERYADNLMDQGFTRSQVDALALLSALPTKSSGDNA
jgi:hypothetical protein